MMEMKPVQVMIVDDEVYIRKILRKVIERQKGFEVVCEYDNMTDALLGFEQFHPQVIFMDIEISGSSGIDCAKVIAKLDQTVKIIFATAHAEYMSNAFELYAFDYLVKPFNIQRIEHTLERIRQQEDKRENTGQSFADFDNKNKADKKHAQLMIKSKESMNFLDAQEIVFIERENNATCIYMSDEEVFQTSMSLGDLESRLDDTIFIRSHKSYIINRNFIKKIEPYGRWTYIVKFKTIQQDALITKEKYEQMKKFYE